MPDISDLCRVPGCNAICPPGSDICSYHREIFDEDVNPTLPSPMHKAMEFLKGRMKDVAMGFQENPEKQMEKLRHQGFSIEEVERLHQQYLDSLGVGA